MKKAKEPAKKELRPAIEGAGTIQEETADGQVAQSGTKPPEKGSNAPSAGEKMLQNGTSVPEKGQNVAQSGKREPSDTSASASGTAPSAPGSENRVMMGCRSTIRTTAMITPPQRATLEANR